DSGPRSSQARVSAGSMTASISSVCAMWIAEPLAYCSATSFSKSASRAGPAGAASSSRRKPSLTAPSSPMAPNSPLGHRAVVDEAVDELADVVAAQAVLGHGVAQLARIGAGGVFDAALEAGEVLLRRGDSGTLVADEDVDDAVLRLHLARPDLLGREVAEAAAFDH